MYWLRATGRSRERVLIIAVLGCLLGCGESILVARELDELTLDAGASSSLDAGSHRKQAINAERARVRARSESRGADSKRHK